jgi:hypothetical protein
MQNLTVHREAMSGIHDLLLDGRTPSTDVLHHYANKVKAAKEDRADTWVLLYERAMGKASYARCAYPPPVLSIGAWRGAQVGGAAPAQIGILGSIRYSNPKYH